MDVKDLMVGDIVLYLDDADLIAVKVVNIDGQSKVTRVQQANGHTFNVMADSLIPLPLTTKILRSNGFNNNVTISGCLDFKETVSHASQDGEVVLSIQLIQNPESKPGVWEIIGSQFHAHIRYLYQLQHCMKIIGFKKEFVLN